MTASFAPSPDPGRLDDLPARRLAPVQPRTMVEQAAEAVVAAAASGAFLPGDRLVEAEIARDLGISRVPVREALRLLESQGIVVSTPYKGMRLMQVTNKGVSELTRVRAALEMLAVREILVQIPRPATNEVLLAPARRAAAEYERAVPAGDGAAIVAADIAFHGELCRASGNATLHAVWQGLSRQLAVIWGLGHGVRPPRMVMAEHAALLDALSRADSAAAQKALEAHLTWHESFDFEGEIAARRVGR
ncbi:GntR family transcriptional regulator [Falsiroseomonas sp. HW251]|uniref:GntR family transcriptional regulator n=1 Tax=Falsiroseomonas sp. HW251 TaxID=3390998 RepID=UPI003D3187BF